MSSRARIGIVVGAVVVLVVAFVIANGSGDDKKDKTTAATTPAATQPATTGGADTGTAATTTPAPAIPVVKVVNAKPQGGIKKLKFTKGDTIRFTVQSDTADEIHFHGYDVHKDVAKGGTAHFRFPAKLDGKFVVELEQHGEQIASLQVEP